MAGRLCGRTNLLMPPVAISLCSKSLRPCGAIRHTELVLSFICVLNYACLSSFPAVKRAHTRTSGFGCACGRIKITV